MDRGFPGGNWKRLGGRGAGRMESRRSGREYKVETQSYRGSVEGMGRRQCAWAPWECTGGHLKKMIVLKLLPVQSAVTHGDVKLTAG